MNSTSDYAYGQRKTLNVYSVNQYFAVHMTRSEQKSHNFHVKRYVLLLFSSQRIILPVMNNYDDGDNIITNIVINTNIPVFAIITALLFHVIHQKAYEND